MSDKQCSSCGGICNPSGCERENEPEALFTVNDRGRWEETDDPNGTPLYTAQQVQPLTNDQIWELDWPADVGGFNDVEFIVRQVEAAHGIGSQKD